MGMLKGLCLWTFDAYENFNGNFVPVPVMQGLRFNGDGTTFNPFGTVNIGGTIIIDATGGVGTYTVAADCTGTLSITGAPTFNIYVGPGAQRVWTLETSPNPAGIGVSVGTATRLPKAVKGPRRLLLDSTSDQLRAWRVPSAPNPSTRLVAEIFKVGCDFEIFTAHKLNHALEVVLLFSGHPNLPVL